MATQEVQKFLGILLTNDGITPSLEVVEKGFHQSRFTEKGKRVEQCTERNVVHLHTAASWAASRPYTPLMSAAAQVPESENIVIRTSRNTPAEGEDHSLIG